MSEILDLLQQHAEYADWLKWGDIKQVVFAPGDCITLYGRDVDVMGFWVITDGECQGELPLAGTQETHAFCRYGVGGTIRAALLLKYCGRAHNESILTRGHPSAQSTVRALTEVRCVWISADFISSYLSLYFAEAVQLMRLVKAQVMVDIGQLIYLAQSMEVWPLFKESYVTRAPMGIDQVLEVDNLRKIPLFSDFDDADISTLLQRTNVLQVRCGATLPMEGKDHLVVMIRGSVYTVVDCQGSPRVLDCDLPGDIIFSLESDVPVQFIAHEHAVALQLSMADVNSLYDEDAILFKRLLHRILSNYGEKCISLQAHAIQHVALTQCVGEIDHV